MRDARDEPALQRLGPGAERHEAVVEPAKSRAPATRSSPLSAPARRRRRPSSRCGRPPPSARAGSCRGRRRAAPRCRCPPPPAARRRAAGCPGRGAVSGSPSRRQEEQTSTVTSSGEAGSGSGSGAGNGTTEADGVVTGALLAQVARRAAGIRRDGRSPGSRIAALRRLPGVSPVASGAGLPPTVAGTAADLPLSTAHRIPSSPSRGTVTRSL